MRLRLLVSGLALAAAACSPSAPTASVASVTGHFTKTMPDSGDEAWLDITAGPSGLPAVHQWQVEPNADEAHRKAAKSAARALPFSVADGDGWLMAFSCGSASGSGADIHGKAKLSPTPTGVSLELVRPPDDARTWDCNGDFDAGFGAFTRR